MDLAGAGALFAIGRTAVNDSRQNGQTVAAENIPLPQFAQRIVILLHFKWPSPLTIYFRRLLCPRSKLQTERFEENDQLRL
jgi:hypothetical protein